MGIEIQTFLPCPTFYDSARVLDYRRLGKQRVEAWQILRTLRGESSGWANHPAVRMWRGHEFDLCHYGIVMCTEWLQRGYVDTMLPRFENTVDHLESTGPPPWMGDDAFHSSHRAALLFKHPAHYRLMGWSESPALAYVWPQ
jgi:hypothetical protein